MIEGGFLRLKLFTFKILETIFMIWVNFSWSRTLFKSTILGRNFLDWEKSPNKKITTNIMKSDQQKYWSQSWYAQKLKSALNKNHPTILITPTLFEDQPHFYDNTFEDWILKIKLRRLSISRRSIFYQGFLNFIVINLTFLRSVAF